MRNLQLKSDRRPTDSEFISFLNTKFCKMLCIHDQSALVRAIVWPQLCANVSWWRHQMEIFSALLALCVTGEFPAQRPVMRSFDVFFDVRLNKRLSKQSWGWWLETLSRSLWRHCNVLPCFFRVSMMFYNRFYWSHDVIPNFQRCLAKTPMLIIPDDVFFKCFNDICPELGHGYWLVPLGGINLGVINSERLVVCFYQQQAIWIRCRLSSHFFDLSIR